MENRALFTIKFLFCDSQAVQYVYYIYSADRLPLIRKVTD